MSLVEISRRLSVDVDRLTFGPPVTHVCNPLRYARGLHEQYLSRYGRGLKHVVFLGMNPGPWGMAQTGVPFGEVAAVRDWMGLSGAVDQPRQPHPKRPVRGLDCPRSEVSGRRLWSWVNDRFGSAESFFSRAFVINHCPLVFMEASGRNFTPNKLPADERAPLMAACDDALRATVDELKPRWVVGIGAYAEKRARLALGQRDIRIGRVLHPSPASPAANRGWAPQATANLDALGVFND